MSTLAQIASEVHSSLESAPKAPQAPQAPKAIVARVAAEVEQIISQRLAAVDRDAEWQRVHSYIADVLKDTHVLYAKLARLEGDFAGEELTRLERISEAVLTLGSELSGFSRAFYEGKYQMAQAEVYGEQGGGGGGGGGETPLPPTPEFPTPELEVTETKETEEVEGGGEGQGQEQGQEGGQESQEQESQQ